MVLVEVVKGNDVVLLELVDDVVLDVLVDVVIMAVLVDNVEVSPTELSRELELIAIVLIIELIVSREDNESVEFVKPFCLVFEFFFLNLQNFLLLAPNPKRGA